MGTWAQNKAQAMATLAPELDRSLAGGIDPPIAPLCEFINAQPDFYTTSSCSGRVVLFWQRELDGSAPDQTAVAPDTAGPGAVERTKARGGSWLYITHEEPSYEEMMAAVQPALPPTGMVVFKQEPFLMHIRCRTMAAAAALYRTARDAGLRESGIVPAPDYPLLALRSTALTMDAVVAENGKWLVSPEYLQFSVVLAHRKMAANLAKLQQLEKRARLDLLMVAGAAGPGGSESGSGAATAGVLAVAPQSVKGLKDTLDQRGWLDQARQIFRMSDGHGANCGGLMAIPLTALGAAVLATAWEQEATATTAGVLPAFLAELKAKEGGVQWLPDVIAPERGTRGGSQRRAADDTPAIRMRRGVAALLSGGDAAAVERLLATLPCKWEKLGKLALLPADCLPSDLLEAAAPDLQARAQLWAIVRAAIGVERLARQAAIEHWDAADGPHTGALRRSRAVMLPSDDASAGGESLPAEDGWVSHRENGIKYELDVTKVMFSSGNGTEKARVAAFDAKGETVLDLFAGIGYFTLPLLVHAGVAHVHACEWNPDAVEALRRGLAANRVVERCTVREGDNRVTARALAGTCDRVMLGLIPSSEASWPVACDALRPDRPGWLHVHANVHTEELAEWSESLVAKLAALLNCNGAAPRTAQVKHIEKVKWYAPKVRHIVADVLCSPGVAPTATLEREREPEPEESTPAPTLATATDLAALRRAAAAITPGHFAGCACCTPGASDGRGRMGPMF